MSVIGYEQWLVELTGFESVEVGVSFHDRRVAVGVRAWSLAQAGVADGGDAVACLPCDAERHEGEAERASVCRSLAHVLYCLVYCHATNVRAGVRGAKDKKNPPAGGRGDGGCFWQ